MAKSKDERVLKELETMIVIVCETLRIASILMLPYTPQLSQGMFERLAYSMEGKNLANEIKFDFTRKLELGQARKHGILIAKVDENPSADDVSK